MKQLPEGLNKTYPPSPFPIIQFTTASGHGFRSDITGDEITYLGMSMYPTFIDGDRLIVDRESPIRRGDIIVYPEPGGTRYIIHRIVHITGDVVRTAGDNNQHPDSYVLDLRDIIGKVIQMRRLDMTSSIRGGLFGRLHFRYAVSIRSRIHTLFVPGKPLHGLLARGVVLGHLFTPYLDIRPVVLIKDGKTEIRLFLNNHYAGVRKGADRPWHIRAPFRLFIDPDQLPEYGVIVREAMEKEIRTE